MKKATGRYVTVEEDVWVNHECPDCGSTLYCLKCHDKDDEQDIDVIEANPPLRPTQLATLKELQKKDKESEESSDV